MPEWLPPTIAVAVITLIGTLVGVAMTRQTAKETNEINESDRLIQNLAAEVERQDARLDKLDRTVQEQGEQIRHLQVQEWSLKRYIATLIDRIRALGSEPPEPPPSANL